MTVNDTDKFIVNRSNSSFNVEQKNLMAELQDTDLMLVNRDGNSFKVTGADIKESVLPDLFINTPKIIAPPNGAGVGGDVTYTPMTSESTDTTFVDNRWINRTSIETEQMLSLFFLNGKFIATGGKAAGAGRVKTSTDGINWSESTIYYHNMQITASDTEYFGCEYQGTNRTVYRSSDGLSWTPVGTITGLNAQHVVRGRLCYGGGVLVYCYYNLSVGAQINIIHSRDNGKTWYGAGYVTITGSTPNIVFTGDRFVVSSESGLCTIMLDKLLNNSMYQFFTNYAGLTGTSLIYNEEDDVLVALNNSATLTNIISYDKGETWLSSGVDNPKGFGPGDYGNGIYMMWYPRYRLMWSETGTGEWNYLNENGAGTDVPLPTEEIGFYKCHGLKYGNGKWVGLFGNSLSDPSTTDAFIYTSTTGSVGFLSLLSNITLTDSNTYDADTGNDMNRPISETFTAGQSVTGIKSDADTAYGTMNTDAVSNTLSVKVIDQLMYRSQPVTSNVFSRPTYDGRYYYIWISTANSQAFLRSENGLTWESMPIGLNNVIDAASGNGTLIAIEGADATATSTANIGISTNHGETWTLSTITLPDIAEHLSRIAFHNGTFLAVNKTGNIWTSTDNGSTWIPKGKVGNFNTLYLELCWTGSYWLIISQSKKLYRASFAANTWTEFDSYPHTYCWGIASDGDGTVIGLHSGSGYYVSTDDGETWSLLQNVPDKTGTDTLYSLDYNNGYWIAGGNRISSSTDLTTWTKLFQQPATYLTKGITGDGNGYLVSYSNASTAYSLVYGPISAGSFEDGMKIVRSTALDDFAPGASTLEFVGNTPSSFPAGAISTWGDATWEVSTDSAFTSPMVGTKIIKPGVNQTLAPDERGAIVLYDDTDYWARLSYNATDPSMPNVTSDAVNFKTASLMNGWFSASVEEANTWRSVTYGKTSTTSAGLAPGTGMFVAVAYDGTKRVMYSIDDGLTWKAVASAEDNSWISVTYGGPPNDERFVAVAQTGTNKVMYSTDGISWTAAAAAAEGNVWNSVTYGDGKFVAVGANGPNSVMYSTDDGLTWQNGSITGEQDNGWISVTYGNGKFVAVAYNGTNRVMYSTDGIDWTVVESAAEASTWYSVTYGETSTSSLDISAGTGLFVAVADSGTDRVMYSTDGINWTAASAAEASSWYSVTYGNFKFVAVASSGSGKRVMHSTDGISWTAASAAEANQWNGVTCGNGKFVAVAGDGTNRVMWSYSGESASPDTYYDTTTNNAISGDALINRYGIDPTTGNLKRLGIAELTEQPTYPVAGYQADGDKYQPIEDQSVYVEELETTITAAQATISEVQASIDKIRSQFGLPVTAELPQAINGFFPLYTSEVESDLVSDNSQSHEHDIDGVTYYMPDTGVTLYHGTYDETTESTEESSGSGSGSGSGY